MSFIQRPEINDIYYDYLDENVCEQTLKYIEKIKDKINGVPFKCKCLTSDSITGNILNVIELRALHFNILAHIQNYMMQSNCFFEGFIEKSWFNLYRKEFFQEYHDHLDNVHRAICGIVYLTDSPQSLTQFYMHHPINVKPEKGKIVIFPDTIEHRVVANETDQERITLAFNYRKCVQWEGIRE